MSEYQPEFISPLKKFNGKNYAAYALKGIVPAFKNKERAEQVAEKFKKRGFSTRIFPKRAPDGRMHYIIYLRKKE